MREKLKLELKLLPSIKKCVDEELFEQDKRRIVWLKQEIRRCVGMNKLALVLCQWVRGSIDIYVCVFFFFFFSSSFFFLVLSVTLWPKTRT
jgi:hypothetical protein